MTNNRDNSSEGFLDSFSLLFRTGMKTANEKLPKDQIASPFFIGRMVLAHLENDFMEFREKLNKGLISDETETPPH